MEEIRGFYEIIRQGYSLDHIYLLLEMKRGRVIEPEGRIAPLLQFLIRKGLCTDSLRITPSGESVINMLNEGTSPNIVRPSHQGYVEWLKTFPLSDGFIWKGHSFLKTRTLRKGTEKTKELFNKIIREGEYTSEDLQGAIIAESIAKMIDSVKKGVNKMSFVVNSESYLRQRVFEAWIDDGRALTEEQRKEYFDAILGNKKTKIVEQQNNSVDI